MAGAAQGSAPAEGYAATRLAEIKASIQRYKEEQEALLADAEAAASPRKPTAMEFERLFEHKYVVGKEGGARRCLARGGV